MRTSTDLPSPPIETRKDGSGGGSGWVELVTAKDDIDAHLVSGLLTSAGIDSMHVHDVRSPVWLYGGADPYSPVRVMVQRLYVDDARIVLAEQALEAPAYRPRSPDPMPSPASRSALWLTTAITVGAILGGLILLQLTRPMIPCQLPVLCGVPAQD
ncbi:MAG: hypothetical protein GEU78_01980 [Actinobacteria bacterium]|nr:hypothetical protein [Actinomycetota bacterium]